MPVKQSRTESLLNETQQEEVPLAEEPSRFDETFSVVESTVIVDEPIEPSIVVEQKLENHFRP
jgi:hypothetical protein